MKVYSHMGTCMRWTLPHVQTKQDADNMSFREKTVESALLVDDGTEMD